MFQNLVIILSVSLLFECYQYDLRRNYPGHGPVFVKQPVNTIFDTSKGGIYSEVTLSCFAVGYPTPEYKWYLEDYEHDRLIEREIDPLTGTKYTISGGNLIIRDPQQRVDQGIYHCKASNRHGTAISESVALNFGYVFEFNYNRSAEYGNQNWGKVIACDEPNYFPKVRFNWARDFFPNFVEEDKRVFVSFDGSLYFSSLEPVDRGNYSCSVRSEVSDVGKNGPFFPFYVYSHSNYQQLYFPNNFPKVFPDAPISGQDLRLECVAFGYPVPSYNWTRSDGLRLPQGSQISNYGRVLVIPKAKIDDQGTYICNAFHDRGSIQNNVTIRIQSEPEFITPLEDKYVDRQSDVSWTCLAFGIPSVNYTWYKNGKLISQDPSDLDYNERYVIDNNMLSIKYVDPDMDAGMYQCLARNQLKGKYSTAQLFTLAMSPTFENSVIKNEILASENGFIEIRCNPNATPIVQYQWRKNNLIVGSSTLSGRGFVNSKNGSLIIYSTKRDDEGLYKCIATNNYGSSEMFVSLIIREGPHFRISLPPSVTLMYHSVLELNCAAESVNNDLDLAYYWYHNNISIGTNERTIIIDGYFTMENVTFLDTGVYKCEIVTAVGNVSTESLVTVLGPPGPPGGLVVAKISTTSVTLQWTDGAVNGYPILGYVIEGRIKSNNTWHIIAEFGVDRVQIIEQNLKQISLDNVLLPWCTYEFVILAINKLGRGSSSLPSPQHSTSPSKPSTFPDKISGGGGKIGDLTVTWDPLPLYRQHGAGIYYIVFWKRKEENQFKKLKLKDSGNTGIAIIQIPAEFFYTEYDVKIQAANIYGEGPQSPIVTIYSAEDMPQVAPQLVFANAYNSTALNVTWQQISENRDAIRGKLIGYRVKYWKRDGNEEDAIYYLSRNTRSWSLIVGLQANTYYMVKVLAYNSAGEGPESERFIQRTYRKAPQKPPSSVIIKGIDPSTIDVRWRYVAPATDEEPVIGFKIRIWKSDQDISKATDTDIKVGRKLETVIHGLTPGISYNLRVLAYSNGGEGRMSSPTSTFKTLFLHIKRVP